MFIVNYIGRFIIMAALVILSIGLWLWLSGEDITQQGLFLWQQIDYDSLYYIQNIVNNNALLIDLWDNYFLTYILLPSAWNGLTTCFIILMLTGGILVFISKSRKKQRQFRN